MGSGSDMDFDYLLGYRAHAGDGRGVEVAIVATSEAWERTERQTRCGGFLGFITAALRSPPDGR